MKPITFIYGLVPENTQAIDLFKTLEEHGIDFCCLKPDELNVVIGDAIKNPMRVNHVPQKDEFEEFLCDEKHEGAFMLFGYDADHHQEMVDAVQHLSKCKVVPVRAALTANNVGWTFLELTNHIFTEHRFMEARTELIRAIYASDDLDKNLYTPESYNAIEEARKEAMELLELRDKTTEDDLRKSCVRISKAYLSLVEVEGLNG